jgi:hypothetical protein
VTPAQPERALGALGRTAKRGGGLDDEPNFRDFMRRIKSVQATPEGSRRRLPSRRGAPGLHSGLAGLALLISIGHFLPGPGLAQQPEKAPQRQEIRQVPSPAGTVKTPLPSGPVQAPPPAGAVQAPPRPATPAKAEWKDGKLSVDADGAPLSEVIREVNRQTGTTALGVNTLTGNVYAHFSGLTLAQAFQKLLFKVNYALIDRKPAGTQKGSPLALLVIFGRDLDQWEPGTGKVSGPGGLRGPRPVASLVVPAEGANPQSPQEKQAAEVAAMARQGDKEGLQKAMFDGDPMVEGIALEALVQQDPAAALDALVKTAKSDQPNVRLDGLQRLDQSGLADEATMLSMLHDATSDSDMQVKAYAIRALGARGGGDAMEYLRQALADQDPAVRLLVVQSAGQTEEGTSILQQALSDTDESVRSAAAMWIQQKAGQ